MKYLLYLCTLFRRSCTPMCTRGEGAEKKNNSKQQTKLLTKQVSYNAYNSTIS